MHACNYTVTFVFVYLPYVPGIHPFIIHPRTEILVCTYDITD